MCQFCWTLFGSTKNHNRSGKTPLSIASQSGGLAEPDVDMFKAVHDLEIAVDMTAAITQRRVHDGSHSALSVCVRALCVTQRVAAVEMFHKRV